MMPCKLIAGRWSAVLIEGEAGQDEAPGNNTIVIRWYRGRKYLCSDTVCLALKDGKKRLQYGLVRSFTDYRGLSESDAENHRLLTRATEEFCLHLLCGGSVREWCKEKGLTHSQGEWKTRTGDREKTSPGEIVTLPTRNPPARRRKTEDAKARRKEP